MILVKFDEKKAGPLFMHATLTNLPGYVSHHYLDSEEIDDDELYAIGAWLGMEP